MRDTGTGTSEGGGHLLRASANASDAPSSSSSRNSTASIRSTISARSTGSPLAKTAARACALAGALVLLLCAAPALAATEGEAPSAAGYWVGRYCTTRACADSKASPLSHVAGFGAAVGGALWLSGRASAKS